MTLPGDFQRGRHTYSYYAAMKMMDCVANNKEHYIKLASDIGKDKDYRKSLSRQIKSRSEVLFLNAKVVQELEHFFIETINSLS